jgi:hypothetical protein
LNNNRIIETIASNIQLMHNAKQQNRSLMKLKGELKGNLDENQGEYWD